MERIVCYWKKKMDMIFHDIYLVRDRWDLFMEHHTCSPQVQQNTKPTWTPLDKTECITEHPEQLTRNTTTNTSIYHSLQLCQMGNMHQVHFKKSPKLLWQQLSSQQIYSLKCCRFLQHIVYCHLHPNNYPIRTTGTVSQPGLIILSRAQLRI